MYEKHKQYARKCKYIYVCVVWNPLNNNQIVNHQPSVLQNKYANRECVRFMKSGTNVYRFVRTDMYVCMYVINKNGACVILISRNDNLPSQETREEGNEAQGVNISRNLLERFGFSF